MYCATLNLNNKKFDGTLTFCTLKNIQSVMLKEFNRDLTISEIFKSIGNDDMEVLTVFLIETTKEDLTQDFLKANLLDKFENSYKYINEILITCMPKKESQSDNDFEDIPDYSNSTDWDFGFMEFMWNTTLKRDDFWNITPKNFFEQLNIYKKINNIKDENVEEL